MTFEVEGPLWLWPGEAGWVFLTIPQDLSDEILDAAPRVAGFGSVKVAVTLGATTWRTSLFPDSKRGCFLLPVKRQVRTAEAVAVGDAVSVTIEPV